MRYRAAGSSRRTSRMVPERGRRSVDSDSSITRSPTSNVMEMLPSVAALRAYGLTSAAATGHWSTRTVEDDPGAPFSNDTTRYVVSGTLTEGTWRNSEIIGAYDVTLRPPPSGGSSAPVDLAMRDQTHRSQLLRQRGVEERRDHRQQPLRPVQQPVPRWNE